MRDKYWHNMAARIQRAWRAYVRHRNESAAKIQRFWKNQKEGLAYARARDYGHQVLAGRKERRRFSLLGQRKFYGDYLDVGGRSAQGELLRSAAQISGMLRMRRNVTDSQPASKCTSVRVSNCLYPSWVARVNSARVS
jgi:myosin-1